MTPTPPFDTSLPSPIARLGELRASAEQSVVRDGRISPVQRIMARPGAVEQALWDAAGAEGGPRLIVLTGSAGSGKTAAIEHLLERDRTEGSGRFGRHLADATHADAPDQDQVARLASFFAPFADDRDEPIEPCQLVAMNTGMALRFFSDLPGLDDAPPLSGLESLLREQLGLPHRSAARADWLGNAVLVVNLDHRPTAGRHSDLFDGILTRLDPGDPTGVLEGATRCLTCHVQDWCWPMANAVNLSRPEARATLNGSAGVLALARGRELAPRALWDAAADLALSGVQVQQAQDPCLAIADVAARQDEDALLHGLASHEALEDPPDGTLLAALASADPSYSPSKAAHSLISDVGLDPATDSRNLLDWLGGADGAHPASRRAASIVARGQLRPPARLLARAAWLAGHLPQAAALPDAFLAALEAQSAGASPGEGEGGRPLLDALEHVSLGFAAAFGVQSGPETFFPTEAPGPRETEVLVEADLVADGLVWTAPEGDPVRARNLRGADLVGYRSLSLALVVAREVPLNVDLPLWSLLQAAIEGTAPSTVDLERFLGLRRAVEAVGRQASNNHRLALLVTHRGTGQRFRVAPFGPTTTLRAREV